MFPLAGAGHRPAQTVFQRFSHILSPGQLKTLPSRISSGVRKQMRDDPLVMWAGMMYLPAAVLTPITLNWDLKRKPEITNDQRHLLTSQEVIRQIISALTYWAGYYGGIIITGLGLKADSSHRSIKKLIGATLLATVGTGILRPIITNAFLARHARQDKTLQKTNAQSENNPFALKTSSPVLTA